jgi:hypothetical protein
MKLKLIALFLALTVMSWAQSTTPNQTPAPEQKAAPTDAKATCPCYDKPAAADHKDVHACMHHETTSQDAKEAMSCCADKDSINADSCCSAKDGKSCSKEDKASAAPGGDGKSSGGHEMACCSGKEGANSSHGCCDGMQCGKHDHHDHAAPGN